MKGRNDCAAFAPNGGDLGRMVSIPTIGLNRELTYAQERPHGTCGTHAVCNACDDVPITHSQLTHLRASVLSPINWKPEDLGVLRRVDTVK